MRRGCRCVVLCLRIIGNGLDFAGADFHEDCNAIFCVGAQDAFAQFGFDNVLDTDIDGGLDVVAVFVFLIDLQRQFMATCDALHERNAFLAFQILVECEFQSLERQ